ncbi:MAG: hypothetical protein V1944_02670 [Candidatus Aenigmatarchaeota archaeon]
MAVHRLCLPYDLVMSTYGKDIDRALDVLRTSSFEGKVVPSTRRTGPIEYTAVKDVLSHSKIDYATTHLYLIDVEKGRKVIPGTKLLHDALKPEFPDFLKRSASIHTEHPHLDSEIIKRIYGDFQNGNQVVLRATVPFVRSRDYSAFLGHLRFWDYTFRKPIQ